MSLDNPLFAVAWALILFVAILLTVELGRWMGKRRLTRDPEASTEGIGAVEGSLFGLLGLLIAFTFSGAAIRFEARRDLITREANHIGTAFLRLDLLAEPVRTELREHFRQYIGARLDYHRKPGKDETSLEFLKRSEGIQQEIWKRAVAACQEMPAREASLLLLPALNEMFDITTTRKMALLNHPPTIIFVMLFILSLGCGVLVGNSIASAKQFDWIHGLSFALLTALAVYVILDLEFPRAGLIRIDEADVVLHELRQSMK